MQKNSDRKRGAILSAVVMITVALLFICAAFAIVPHADVLLAICFLLLWVAVILAVIIGILVALAQRLKEFKKGEAEEAKKY